MEEKTFFKQQMEPCPLAQHQVSKWAKAPTHLDFGASPRHPGDVTHDVFGSHCLSSTTFATKERKTKRLTYEVAHDQLPLPWKDSHSQTKLKKKTGKKELGLKKITELVETKSQPVI